MIPSLVEGLLIHRTFGWRWGEFLLCKDFSVAHDVDG